MYQLTITRNNEILKRGKFKQKSSAIFYGNTIYNNYMSNALAKSYQDYFELEKILKIEIKDIQNEG